MLNKKETCHLYCSSAIQILQEVVEAYHARKVKVSFVRLRERPMELFRKSGLLGLVGQANLFKKVSDAIEAIEKDMTNPSMTIPL
jgi:MFS superfamily sulfate permease-like transporter